ncbi:MAG: methyltransferase domain-containing protein [Desulfobacterales bacterium]|nr:methyltransferase domain-containing protein [Desulfobacterales bacterium]MCP4163411.1 methyltransferase domain-containing protein [Deltaproteobacteria bacterium]
MQAIGEKTRDNKVTNLYTVDGTSDSLPFSENSIDYLMTSQAIGWNLQAELYEIERVLKPDGCAIHLFTDADSEDVNGFHDILTSSKYECTRMKNASGIKLKYHMAKKIL